MPTRPSSVVSVQEPLGGFVLQLQRILESLRLRCEIVALHGLPKAVSHAHINSVPARIAEATGAVPGLFLVAARTTAFHVLRSPSAADVNELRDKPEQFLLRLSIKAARVENQETLDCVQGRFHLRNRDTVQLPKIKDFLRAPAFLGRLRQYFNLYEL
jgi:hypothetical protein